MPYKDPERKKEYMRQYNLKNSARLNAYHKEKHARYRAQDPEAFRLKGNARAAAWRSKHPEKAKAVMRKYASAHRSELRLASRDYAKRNPEMIKKHSLKRRGQPFPEAKKRWFAANKDRTRVTDHRKRAKRRMARGKFTTKQWFARCDLYGWCCAYCGIGLTKKTVQVDHVIALARGGTNWPANLVPACATCNVKKGVKRIRPSLPKPVSKLAV